ncbi:MAG: lignostilbene-alpha,beta-dioxygenase [Chloroflexi bacterium]|jgi:all-trans-8'-apo-beta-carotenal 15,15'-oxygenase|nr:lignostilbene-alpha,beta-dioxygenase [Chloroflexota bacterium]
MARLAPPPLAVDSNTGWQLGFRTLDAEVEDGLELEVTGRLPAELRGILHRIGPARFEVAGERYRHWLDGDGMVHALHLGDGRVRYRNRFVATAGKAEEDREGRRLYAGFGTRPGGGTALARLRNVRRRPAKNTANTNVVWMGGRLLALWEAGHPHRLDPVTLATAGEDDLGVLGPAATFSAHPKRHPGGDMWNFGVRYGRRSHVDLYRCPATGPVTHALAVSLPFNAMVHDFALTERRAVLVVQPLLLPSLPVALLVGARSYAESLRWEPHRGTHVAVIDLDGGGIHWYRGEPFSLFHTVNAWDEGDDVVLDVIAYPDPTLIVRTLADVMTGRLDSEIFTRPERIVLRRDQSGFQRRRLSETTLEFPRVSPASESRPHRLVYGITNRTSGGFIGVPACVDAETGAVATAPMTGQEYAGELVPVAKAQARTEADVWLLSLVLDAATERTELRVFDGADLASGSVATVRLPHAVPFGFHGNWLDDAELVTGGASG